ncbi:type 4 pilus major pilin [Pseudomonas aeruginosa]|uniref:type 4 pilus major pilin n=1 Tax=Pseudomonas aeruginosa TaxID=287 RepID=UPI00106632DD|nr:type 4 pilus major pilin [Pseudomonas aeruginosa]
MIINKNGKVRGLTLIESLVVVGILLGIVAVALTLYGTVRDRLNVKNESENISFMFSQVRDLYSDETTGDSLVLDVAIDAGVIPSKMTVTDSGKVYNTWGGEIDLEGEGDNGFILTYEKVPSGSVCVNLVSNQKKVGWDSYNIEDAGNRNFSSLRAADLAKDCKSSEDYIDIVFTYGEDE